MKPVLFTETTHHKINYWSNIVLPNQTVSYTFRQIKNYSINFKCMSCQTPVIDRFSFFIYVRPTIVERPDFAGDFDGFFFWLTESAGGGRGRWWRLGCGDTWREKQVSDINRERNVEGGAARWGPLLLFSSCRSGCTFVVLCLSEWGPLPASYAVISSVAWFSFLVCFISLRWFCFFREDRKLYFLNSKPHC